MPNIVEQNFRVPSKLVSTSLIILLLLNSSQVFLTEYKDELLAASTIISLMLMSYYKRTPSLLFICFLSMLLFWISLIVLQYDVWNVYTFIGFLCRILFAYSVVRILKESFFPLLFDVVYKLVLISIPLYVIGLLLPVIMHQIHTLLSSFSPLFIIDHGEYSGWIRANFLVYTFSMDRLDQNHGFMWEPTAFAGVILFAMMIHLTMNGSKLDTKFSVLLMALLTTLSTTGFVAFSIIALFVLMNGKANRKVMFGFAMIILIPFVFSLDMVSGKIEKEFSRGSYVSNLDADITMTGNSRLSSFIYDMQDFSEHPLIGLGVFEENRYSGHQFLGSVNGVGDTISRFGLIIAPFFLINIMLTFKRFANEYKVRGYLLFTLLFLMLSWSERLTILPLFFAFQLYYMQPRCRNQSEQSIYANHSIMGKI